MLHVIRGEEFTLELSLDTEMETLQSLDVSIVQNGRCVLRRKKADAESGADGDVVFFTFTGTETARLCAGEPAFAQARAALPGGAVMRSETKELCVYDALCTEEAKTWS